MPLFKVKELLDWSIGGVLAGVLSASGQLKFLHGGVLPQKTQTQNGDSMVIGNVGFFWFFEKKVWKVPFSTFMII